MEEKPKNSYQEYKEPFNYLGAITLASLGTLLGLILWISMANSKVFSYHALILIVAPAFFGARFQQPKGQYISLIITIVVSVAAFFVGDVIETTIIYGAVLAPDEYLTAVHEKYNGYRIAQYLIVLGLPLFLEFSLRRLEARGRIW